MMYQDRRPPPPPLPTRPLFPSSTDRSFHPPIACDLIRSNLGRVQKAHHFTGNYLQQSQAPADISRSYRIAAWMARCPPLIPLGPARPSAAPQPPPPPTPPLSSSSTLHRLRSLFRARDFSCAAAAINAPAYFAFSSTWSWPAISFCPSAVWWGVGGGEGEEGFYFRWQLLHARRLGAVPIPTVIGHFFPPLFFGCLAH